MARTLAKTTVEIWADPDWRQTPEHAQRLYWLLLGQPRLTLAGTLELRIPYWASLGPTSTLETVGHALAELERRRYVVVDHLTGELVIRTFTKHDLAGTRLNINLIKGFWSAWRGVMSPTLRKVIVDNLPDVVWDKAPDEPPEAAREMRRSARLELPVQTNGSDDQLQLAVPTNGSNHPSPSPPPSPSTAATARPNHPFADTGDPTPAPGGGNPDSPAEFEILIDAAARTLAEREAQRRFAAGEIGSLAGYTNGRLRTIRDEHHDRWLALLTATPRLTAIDLIDAIQRPGPTSAPPRSDSTSSAIPDAATVIAEHAVDPGDVRPMPDDLRHRIRPEETPAP